MKEQYVITDPSYILPEDVWANCCNECEELGVDNWDENFDKIVEKALTEFAGAKAYVASTGFGDWDNQLYGPNVINCAFTADAGEVCVVKYTEAVRKGLEDNNIPEHCYGLFEAIGDIAVEFDTDCSDWTVVNITDKDGSCWNTSLPYSEEEDDE